MPRDDWDDENEIRSRQGYGGDRGYRDYDDRSRRAFFNEGREDARRRPGGRASLLNDESSGVRERQSRDREFSAGPNLREEHSYGSDDNRRGIPRDETERLIASNKVEGTPVYDRNGERLGSVYNFMVDKFRGRVVYALLRHSSGFLGLDDRYYPLEWDQLTYDTRLGGYRVDITEDQLKKFGSWDQNERWTSGERRRGRSGFERQRPYFRDSMGEDW